MDLVPNKGAIVFWNVDVEQEQALVSVLTDLCDEETLLNEIEEDDYFYQYSFDEDAAKCYITPQSFILAQVICPCPCSACPEHLF